MSKFNIGDKVKILNHDKSGWDGRVGIYKGTYRDNSLCFIEISGHKYPVLFYEENLERIEEMEIDYKVGDTVINRQETGNYEYTVIAINNDWVWLHSELFGNFLEKANKYRKFHKPKFKVGDKVVFQGAVCEIEKVYYDKTYNTYHYLIYYYYKVGSHAYKDDWSFALEKNLKPADKDAVTTVCSLNVSHLEEVK